MTLQLPEPNPDVLDRSPLSLVVCQVRHEHTEAPAENLLQLSEAFSDLYPIAEEQVSQDMSVLGGPSGVQTLPGRSAQGWRFKSKDGLWTVVVMPDFFALETTAYTTWSAFKGRLQACAQAVQLFSKPVFERRLGIRYVSQLSEPDVTEPVHWLDKVDRGLLGATAHPALGPCVSSAQSLTLLQASGEISVLMRQGCTRAFKPGDSSVYLLDHDCYREGGRRFDVQDLIEGAESIHKVALQIFQATLTPDYYEQLRNGGAS